jgi:hypothetical protein
MASFTMKIIAIGFTFIPLSLDLLVIFTLTLMAIGFSLGI